jgi:RNA polymerase sigma-70 factor (ECF subfamily)
LGAVVRGIAVGWVSILIGLVSIKETRLLGNSRVVGASREEIEALYRERYLGFRRALAAVTGSYESAHDVVQEAFARALAQAHTYRGEAPLGAWVWGIALGVARDERRRSLPLPLDELLEEGLVEPARDPQFSDALRRLPPRRRLIFFLRYFADMSYQEIAAVCGVREGTVAASIAQARSSLVDLLLESNTMSEQVGQ